MRKFMRIDKTYVATKGHERSGDVGAKGFLERTGFKNKQAVLSFSSREISPDPGLEFLFLDTSCTHLLPDVFPPEEFTRDLF